MYRKPNGEYTEDAEEMTDAWLELAAPIEDATGWILYAFHPNLAFHAPPPHSWQNVQIPVEFAQALVSALQGTNSEPISRLELEKGAEEESDVSNLWKTFAEDDAAWMKVKNLREAKQMNQS